MKENTFPQTFSSDSRVSWTETCLLQMSVSSFLLLLTMVDEHLASDSTQTQDPALAHSNTSQNVSSSVPSAQLMKNRSYPHPPTPNIRLETFSSHPESPIRSENPHASRGPSFPGHRPPSPPAPPAAPKNYSSFGRRLPKWLVKAAQRPSTRRAVTLINGVMLSFTGPVVLRNGFLTGSTLQNALSGLWSSAFGVLLLIRESGIYPLHSWIQNHFQFLLTQPGQLAFSLCAATMSFGAGHAGVTAGLFTLANAWYTKVMMEQDRKRGRRVQRLEKYRISAPIPDNQQSRPPGP